MLTVENRGRHYWLDDLISVVYLIGLMGVVCFDDLAVV